MSKLVLFFNSAEEAADASLTEAFQRYVDIPWITSVDKIAEHQPKFILALGADAVEQLTGIAKLKIKSHRGKILFSEKFSAKSKNRCCFSGSSGTSKNHMWETFCCCIGFESFDNWFLSHDVVKFFWSIFFYPDILHFFSEGIMHFVD